MSTSGGSKPSAERRSVLIAVEPRSFIRLIEHLLDGHPELRVVGRSSKSGALALAGRLAPDVIIANTRLDGRERSGVLAGLKRSSPASSLILLTRALGEPFQEPSGADVCLPEEAVVKHLLPAIHRLPDPGPRSRAAHVREQRRSLRS
jgi:DNA-binding NarL/FixJ family response regulator